MSLKNSIMNNSITMVLLFWVIFLSFKVSENDNKSKACICPEPLPTEITDMFTIKGDTLIIKQGVDFVISTKIGIVDSTGIIHRNKRK